MTKKVLLKIISSWGLAGAFSVLAAVLFMTLPSNASDITTIQGLRDACGSHDLIAAGNAFTRDQAMSSGYCMGYIRGYTDGGGWAASSTCIPSEVTIGQQVKVFEKYVDDHPEELHHGLYIITGKAFQLAFPCSTTKEKPTSK